MQARQVTDLVMTKSSPSLHLYRQQLSLGSQHHPLSAPFSSICDLVGAKTWFENTWLS
jgi:hypothetical protein